MSTAKNVTSENFKEVYDFGLSSYRISEKKIILLLLSTTTYYTHKFIFMQFIEKYLTVK